MDERRLERLAARVSGDGEKLEEMRGTVAEVIARARRAVARSRRLRHQVAAGGPGPRGASQALRPGRETPGRSIGCTHHHLGTHPDEGPRSADRDPVP
jgi:hypothetical protein